VCSSITRFSRRPRASVSSSDTGRRMQAVWCAHGEAIDGARSCGVFLRPTRSLRLKRDARRLRNPNTSASGSIGLPRRSTTTLLINLPQSAPGLGSSVENVDVEWFVETSMGRVGFAFVQRNDYGILDHDVTLPSGEVIYNPMRVIRDGSGSEVVFTLRRLSNATDDDFARDAEAVASDLKRLKGLLERR
jgi:hypothetical protein